MWATVWPWRLPAGDGWRTAAGWPEVDGTGMGVDWHASHELANQRMVVPRTEARRRVLAGGEAAAEEVRRRRELAVVGEMLVFWP